MEKSPATPEEDEQKRIEKRVELEGQAVVLLQAAIKHDTCGDYVKAVEQYEAALHCLVQLALLYSSESETTLKSGLRAKMTEVADRAETLRTFLCEQKAKEKEKEKEAKGEKDMRECEEVLQIEGVQCLHIHDGDQEEVGRGTLRILKVPIADNEMRSHKHLFRSFEAEEVNGRQVVRLTFLALGDCQLPLIPGLPCLRTTPLSFLLPMQQEGHYVAYIFPNNIPSIYIDVFERKMRETCEVKHSYGDPSDPQADVYHASGPGPDQQSYTVEEVRDEDENEHENENESEHEGEESESEGAEGKENGERRVVVARTDVKIANDDGESWQVTNEVITFGSDAQGAVVPYRPFDKPVPLSEKTASYLDLMASAIDTGSAYLSDRLEKGSEAFAKSLAETVQQAKESGWLTPNQEEMVVNPLIKGTIHYGSRVSPIAVTASGAVVNGLVYAAEGLGKVVGMGVAKVAPKGSGGPGYAPVQSAIGVGGATVRGVVSVWDALENAGKTVLSASSGATVTVVQHKYGSEAAEVVSKGLSMGGDIVVTVSNVRSLGVKKLAKRAAKKSTISAARTVVTIRTDESGQPLAIEDVKKEQTRTIEFSVPQAAGAIGQQPQQLLLEDGRQYTPLLTIEEVDHDGEKVEATISDKKD